MQTQYQVGIHTADGRPVTDPTEAHLALILLFGERDAPLAEPEYVDDGVFLTALPPVAEAALLETGVLALMDTRLAYVTEAEFPD